MIGIGYGTYLLLSLQKVHFIFLCVPYLNLRVAPISGI